MKSKIKKNFFKEPFLVIVFILLIFYVISFLVPVVWALLSSVKRYNDFVLNPFGLPKEWMFSNYSTVLSELYVKPIGSDRNVYFVELMFNSVVYSILTTVVYVITHAVAAYIAAKYKHRFISKFMYTAVIVTMVLPVVGNLPAELNVMKTLKYYDTLYGLCFMKAGFLGTDFLIFYATFKGISWEYAEAAFVDGASNTSVMINIMLPLAKTALFAVGIVTFITNWNDWKINLVYLPSFPMISYALYTLLNTTISKISLPPFKLAACFIVMIPVLVFFIAFKDKLMGNITMGGIKG